MHLFLDDVRNPPCGKWVIARSVAEAIKLCLNSGCPQVISFDHDLGIEQNQDGYEFAQWLIARDLDQPGFIPQDFAFDIHSANPVGAANIRNLLERYLRFRETGA